MEGKNYGGMRCKTPNRIGLVCHILRYTAVAHITIELRQPIRTLSPTYVCAFRGDASFFEKNYRIPVKAIFYS